MTIKYLDSKRIVGLSTDIAQTTTYETETFATGWEQNTTGTTNIAVANSRVEYDVTDSGTSQSTLVYDLGTSNISETSWTLRGKSVINNYSSTSGSSCHFFCGLSNGSKTVAFDGSQNSISFAIGVGTSDTAYYLGSSVNGAMYAMTNQTSGNITHLPTAETVWFEIKRNNATSATITLYTDSTYTTSPAGYSRTLTLSSAPTGLRYLVFKSRDRSIASQSLDGYVDDLEFYNGTTSSKPISIQDNSILVEKDTGKRYWFDEATPITYPASGVLPTGTTTTDWTLTGTTISSSALNFNSAQASTQNDGVYDLGTALSDTAFVVRFKYTIANLTSGNESNINAYLGLFSGTGNFLASQDYIGLSYYTASSTNYFYANAENNSGIDETGSTGRIYDGSVSATTYYVEIKRTSATSGEISIGTNSDFTTGRTTQTTFQNGIVAGITGLQYIGIKNRSNVPTLGSAVFNGTISDIEVYNGVTSITPATWTREIPSFTGSYFMAGGTAGPWTPVNYHDQFNGTTWATASNLTTAVSLNAGTGTKTDGAIFGGDTGGTSTPVNNNQSWTGSSWSAAQAMNTTRNQTTGGGATGSTSGWVAGGRVTSSGNPVNTSEQWNGTSWSTGGNMSGVRRNSAGAGIVTEAWNAGGYTGSVQLDTMELYNGTAWSAGSNIHSITDGLAQGGGDSYNCYYVGGNEAAGTLDHTHIYNGTSWSLGNPLTFTVKYNATMGTPQDGITACGFQPNGSGWAGVWAATFNGTSWTSSTNVTRGRGTGAGGT